MAHGYSGRILRVDLTSRIISQTPTSDYTDRFVGGRGLGTRIYWDEVSPHVDAFDPENRLIVVTGPLGGFPGLSGSVWQIYGKSPATRPQQFCYSTLIGSWGAHLKFSGYDAIVLKGRSEKPAYLFLHNGIAEIRDAAHLWGKGSIEARETLKRELGASTRVMATGTAGDNLVIFASILADDDASGSAGFGAVMGSKNLKAIAVNGASRPAAAFPEKLADMTAYVRELNRDKLALPMTMYPDIPGVTPLKYACYGCISGCHRGMVETEDGRKSKRFCQSARFYQERVGRYYGKYTEVAVEATRLCNQYGLDTRATDAVILWLSKARESGILTDEKAGIPISKMGSLEFIQELVKKISHRDGFGDVLARGVSEAARAAGDTTKDLEADYVSISQSRALIFDPRNYITTGIIYALEPRQAMWQLNEIGTVMAHFVGWANRSRQPLGELKAGQPHPMMPGYLIQEPSAVKAALDRCYVSGEVIREVARQFWGSVEGADFSTYKGKALAAVKIQDRSYAKESLGLCTIVWPCTHAVHSAGNIGDPTIESRLLSAVTGRTIDPEELLEVGERVFNVQRAILLREGRMGRQNDILPDFCFKEPLGFDAYNPECLVPGKGGEVISRRGAVLNRDAFETLKDEYYRLRGWDVASGLQTEARLKQLDLPEIARVLTPKGLAV